VNILVTNGKLQMKKKNIARVLEHYLINMLVDFGLFLLENSQWTRITVYVRGLQYMDEDYSIWMRITVYGRGLQYMDEDYSIWTLNMNIETTMSITTNK
jgi:hypothetical protein